MGKNTTNHSSLATLDSRNLFLDGLLPRSGCGIKMKVPDLSKIPMGIYSNALLHAVQEKITIEEAIKRIENAGITINHDEFRENVAGWQDTSWYEKTS